MQITHANLNVPNLPSSWIKANTIIHKWSKAKNPPQTLEARREKRNRRVSSMMARLMRLMTKLKLLLGLAMLLAIRIYLSKYSRYILIVHKKERLSRYKFETRTSQPNFDETA